MFRFTNENKVTGMKQDEYSKSRLPIIVADKYDKENKKTTFSTAK